jgi:DNA-binding NarL/FixJ family response regulator
MSLRVVIADDHPLLRQGLRGLLATLDQAEVVAEACTAEQAVRAAIDHAADVVVMDLHMPGGGIEATRRLRERAPQVRILVLTMHEDHQQVFAAVRAGARGYLLKSAEPDEIIRALLAVADGHAIFSPAIAAHLIDFFVCSAAQSQVFPQLTDREREVLDLIAAGQNNQAIARKLGLSLKTVRNHVSNTFAKLQVADRAQAIVQARQAGLGTTTRR